MAQKKSPIKNRVVELRWEKASKLKPNARNWRKHPKKQAAALDVAVE